VTAHEADAAFPEAVYPGLCAICGHKGSFAGKLRGSREYFACPSCGATHRWREQAAAILSVFARGRSPFLSHFVRQPECQALAILEAAIRGPFIRRLRAVPGYVQAYLFEDLAPGDSRDGIVCQDLEKMTFADQSFDLIVTSDVMEHVFDVDAVIAETARILKPGGAHIFSLPLAFPLKPVSRLRARRSGGGVEHLVEPRYHRSGTDEPSLVVTDHGADLIVRHAAHALSVRFFRGLPWTGRLQNNAAVIARRLSS
jgi:SAM-dependent methyltransferase